MVIYEREELQQLKNGGYSWNDPFDIVDIFEKKVAHFAGSKYGVAVDSCSSGIFLSLKYINKPQKIKIPINTYISVPMQIIHAGYDVEFIEKKWSGIYQLQPIDVWDGAGRWGKNMYVGNGLHVLSFQMKKQLPIGKGGMILCNNKKAYLWLKKAKHDGRDMKHTQFNDNVDTLGWHVYMTPEDAARGIILMDNMLDVNVDTHNHTSYNKLTEHNIFKDHKND